MTGIILNAITHWDHTVQLYEAEFTSVGKIRSGAATSTHVKQPISGIASKFVNRI